MDFQNSTISLSELPKVETAVFLSLDKSYLNLSLISTSLFWLFILIGGMGILNVNDSWPSGILMSYGIPVWAVLFAVQLVLTYLGFSKKAYALRQRDILYQTGLIWHKTIAIPFNRIQHCSVQQGPVARYFGLAHLNVFTAGGSSSDLTIPGLVLDDAQKIKDFILQQSALQHESE